MTGTPPDPQITVIVVAYNSGVFLQPCLNSLKRQTYENFEVVIVDNASTDGSVDALSLPDHRFRIDRPGSNLGFAGANNRVARQSKSPWIALLNPDAEATPDWLEQLLKGAQDWPGCDAFGSTQIQMEDPDLLDGAGDVWHAGGLAWRALINEPVAHNPPSGESFAPCAAAALYNRDQFVALGGFDERYFCYCEDVDYGFRLRLSGGFCIQLDKAIVTHAGSGTTGRYSEFTVFHGHRNRIWTFFKNTPLILMTGLLPFHLLINLYLYARAPSALKPVMRQAYGAALKGLGDIFESRKPRRAKLVSIIRAMAWSPHHASRRDALLTGEGQRRGRQRK